MLCRNYIVDHVSRNQNEIAIRGDVRCGKVKERKRWDERGEGRVRERVIFPHWLYKEVANISFEFIWRENDRIKQAIMYQDYDFGGL